jgi:hypothetical protein
VRLSEDHRLLEVDKLLRVVSRAKAPFALASGSLLKDARTRARLLAHRLTPSAIFRGIATSQSLLLWLRVSHDLLTGGGCGELVDGALHAALMRA